jgi:predicted transcriptional regulator
MSKPLKPPRESDERAKLWRALRMMRTATTGELSAVTERTLGAVQSDLQRLARTGFVAEPPTAPMARMRRRI